MNFEAFQLDPRLMAGVRALGYTEPTPIQEQAIPPILEGNDVMGLAQTGTGKTAAFVLPILQRLLTGPRGRVRALIISPTRELAEQTHVAITQLGQQTRIRSITVYGGVSMNAQSDKLRGGVEIVVACPGRLLDHLKQGQINLAQVEVLVLDEADRMFDMGFLPEVRKIIKHVPAKRQTLFFSATMPDDVRQLARDVLGNPTRVQIGEAAPATTVSHALYPIAPHLKTALLLELLRHTDTDSVLVFTRTKHRAKRLGEQLKKGGYNATSLQGNLSQNKRQASLDGFRSGKFQIMVATDIAARGIDVSSISHVINYDMPDTADAYTHRIGRTGRAAKTGDAFTLVTQEDADMVKTIERILGTKLDRRTLPEFDYKQPKSAGETDSRPPFPSRPFAQRQEYPRRPNTSSPKPVSRPAPGNNRNAPAPYVSRLAADLPSQQAGYRSRPPANKRRRYSKR
ncbi:MAG: DEAD/DEAH box helicase [Chloroflexi bacterium]|nr:DEAD/DEAH box helicase [Chloroflexota bacterium]